MMHTLWKDWERYPDNLGLNHVSFDIKEYQKTIFDRSAQLFVPNEDTHLKIIEVGSGNTRIKGLGTLETYLESKPSHEGTRILLIPQQHSWSSLGISEEALKKVLTALKVSPMFLDIVHCFGQRVSAQGESSGEYRGHWWPASQTSEICYLLRHVEMHERPDFDDPWSIRQMGVYHARKEEQDTFIIINPPMSFQTRLQALISNLHGSHMEWQDLHLLVMSSMTVKWKHYIDFLEERVITVTTRAQRTTVGNEDSPEKADFGIRFSDVQYIQVLRDKLCRLDHILNESRSIFESLESSPNIPATATPGYSGPKLDFVSQTSADIRRVASIIRKLEGASELIRSVLDFRNFESLHRGTQQTLEMTRLARTENSLMMLFAKMARHDSLTLKTISILTLIFLPASFVSTLLSMGYVKINAVNAKGFQIVIAPEMLIFVVLTTILLAGTLGAWLYLDRRNKALELKNSNSLP